MNQLIGEKVVYTAKADTEKNFEYVLPEYLPGGARVVKTSVHPESCTFIEEEGNAGVRILLKIRVVYISDYDGRIKSCAFLEDFTMSFGEEPVFDGEYIAVPSLGISGVQCVLITPRKISVKVHLSSGVIAYAENSTPIYIPDTEDGICVQQITLPVCRKKTLNETIFEGEAEISVEEGKTVGEIIYADACFTEVKTDPHDGYTDFEATAAIHILYETPSPDDEDDDVTYAFLDTVIKLSNTLHCEKTGENDKSFIYLDMLSVEPSTAYDTYGENKSLSLSVKYSVSGFSYECGECSFVTDAFAENSSAEPQFSRITTEQIVSGLSKKEHISQLVRTNLADITDIANCKAEIQSVSLEQAEGKFTAAAKCRLEIFGTNPSGELYSIEAPTMLRIPVTDDDSFTPEAVPEIILNIQDCKARIKDGGLQADFDVSVNGVWVKKTPIDVVCSIENNEESHTLKNNGEILIYYPKKDEELWSIAKKYRVNPEKLCRANKVDDKNFSKKHTLIIP